MKKHFLNIALLLLAVWVMSACQENENIITIDKSNGSTEGKWTLVIENTTSRGLSLSGDPETLTPTWDTSDDVYVYYDNAKMGIMHPKSNGSGVKQFVGDLNDAVYTVGQTLEMYYRRDKTDIPVFTGQKGTIPDIAANFDFANATTVITEVDNANKVITANTAVFHSEEAVMRFKFDKDLVAGDLLTVSALEFPPSGTASAPGLVKSTATVTLESAVTANNPVYVAIPVDGVSSHYEVIVTRSNKDIFTGGAANKTLENGKYYGATIALDSLWQLWAGGPAFHIRNLGAAKVTDGGLFYAWGETVGREASSTTSFSSENYQPGGSVNKMTVGGVLKPAYDAARVALGGSWRMPTRAEVFALTIHATPGPSDPYQVTVNEGAENITAVDFVGDNKYHGMNGVLFRGKGNYVNNTIFLPFAGYYDNDEEEDVGITGLNEEGNFWTATNAAEVEQDSRSFCLYWSHYDGEDLEIKLYTDNPYAGQNIRPVQTVE